MIISLKSKMVLTCLLLSTSYANANCNDLLNQQLSLLDKTLTEFDQTPNRGWRVLSEQKCFSESALLIERYMAHNNQKSAALLWHLFQMNAMAGQNQKAIKIAKSIAASAPDSQPSFLWKEYVLANIAFLEGDNNALLKNRNLIAQHKEHKPNAMNLVMLDKLISNIKKSYLDAYSI